MAVILYIFSNTLLQIVYLCTRKCKTCSIADTIDMQLVPVVVGVRVRAGGRAALAAALATAAAVAAAAAAAAALPPPPPPEKRRRYKH